MSSSDNKPHYKLIYFDIKGIGECIKYMFAYKGIEYECETVVLFTGPTTWYETKKSFPFGQLPVLEVDGKRLYQSQAICQYLAHQLGLSAGDQWEDAHLLALAGCLQDWFLRTCRYYYERNVVKKEELRIERENISGPFYLERFESLLKEKGDFYNNGKLTWIDFYIVGGLETISGMMGRDLVKGKYPALEGLMNRIWSLPGVKEYIATRPLYTR